MKPQEIMADLAASHMAVLATVNRNGHPHLTPNWYRYDGQVLTFLTRKDRLKYRHLQRDQRLSVCMYDPPAALNDVVISRTAPTTCRSPPTRRPPFRRPGCPFPWCSEPSQARRMCS